MKRTEPPKTRKALFDSVRKLIAHGWYDLPNEYRGTGAPCIFLEYLLCLTAGNKDIPDSVGWELKWFSERTNLVTLFHKTPHGPDKIMRYLVRKHGWKDAQNRMSFRHTIMGKSDRFRVFDDNEQIIVHPLKGKGPAPYWSQDELIAAVGGKLRRLLLVRGERKQGKVRFIRADAFETFLLSEFVYEVTTGGIAIDFDVRERAPESPGLRDHGTKFRIPPDSVCRLYAKKEGAYIPKLTGTNLSIVCISR